MIIHKPHLLTHIPVWEPRYHDRCALPLKRKIDFGSGVIIFEFPKSNAYKDGRYCMLKKKAQSYPVEKKGNYEVYAIPMSDFDSWDSAQEVHDIAMEIFS